MAWLRVPLHWNGLCPEDFVGINMQVLWDDQSGQALYHGMVSDQLKHA